LRSEGGSPSSARAARHESARISGETENMLAMLSTSDDVRFQEPGRRRTGALQEDFAGLLAAVTGGPPG
jgi:hypothetical protein